MHAVCTCRETVFARCLCFRIIVVITIYLITFRRRPSCRSWKVFEHLSMRAASTTVAITSHTIQPSTSASQTSRLYSMTSTARQRRQLTVRRLWRVGIHFQRAHVPPTTRRRMMARSRSSTEDWEMTCWTARTYFSRSVMTSGHWRLTTRWRTCRQLTRPRRRTWNDDCALNTSPTSSTSAQVS